MNSWEWRPISLHEELENGTRVAFDNSVVAGEGWISGIASTALPIIGITYIVRLWGKKIGPDMYHKYDCIAMFACHLKTLHPVNGFDRKETSL